MIIRLLIVIFSLESDVLPYSIRVLLEAAVRNCDGFLMKREDVMNILDWKTKQSNVEVPFFPARVLLQDFTWVIGLFFMMNFQSVRFLKFRLPDGSLVF